MKILTLILFLAFCSQTKSQIKTYEFSFCGRDQKVILFEKNNGKISGFIESNFFNKNTTKKLIKSKKIPKGTAKKIINEINNFGVYDLKDRDDKINCGDFYLDGDYFSVKISDSTKKFQKTYGEIYPESETKYIEENNCRRKAQLLATIIDRELNLKSKYKQQFKKLGSGTCYWTGISQVCQPKNTKL